MNETSTAICSIAKRIAFCNTEYPWLGEAVVDWLAVPISNNVVTISFVYCSLMSIVPKKECLELTEQSIEVRTIAGEFIIFIERRLAEYERMFGPTKQAVFPGTRADWMAEVGSQVMLIKDFIGALVLKEKTGVDEDIVLKLGELYNDYRTNPEWFYRE